MKKKSTFRILFTVILIAVFLLLIIILSSFLLNKNIKLRIEDEFSKQSKGSYALKINAVKLNLLAMALSFKGISILPDTNKVHNAIYRFKAKEINFTGIGMLTYFFKNEIDITTVKLIDPSIELIKGENSGVSKSDTAGTFSLYGFIQTFANAITLHNLTVDNFNVILYNKSQDNSPSLMSNDNSFIIKNFHIGQSTTKLPGYFEADTIVLFMRRFSYTPPDSLYTFSVKELRASFMDSILLVDSISFIPNFSKSKFGDVVGKQTDRFDIKAKSLILEKLDLRRFLEHHSFIASSGAINGFYLIAHRDRNDKREYNVPASLQKILKDAPIYLKIDTLHLNDAEVAYEEVSPGNTVPGKLTFNNILAKFTGITNDSSAVASGGVINFTANCKLMNTGNLSATYKIPLSTEQMDFYCTGFLTDMPMDALNGVLGPLAGIRVKDGYIDTLDFSFHARENTSNGTMKFLYHNLDLGLSDDGPDNISGKDRLMMFIANTFIFKDANPEINRPPRISSLHYERNKQRFMFNYTWKTILSGIKQTVGLKENKKL